MRHVEKKNLPQGGLHGLRDRCSAVGVRPGAAVRESERERERARDDGLARCPCRYGERERPGSAPPLFAFRKGAAGTRTMGLTVTVKECNSVSQSVITTLVAPSSYVTIGPFLLRRVLSQSSGNLDTLQRAGFRLFLRCGGGNKRNFLIPGLVSKASQRGLRALVPRNQAARRAVCPIATTLARIPSASPSERMCASERMRSPHTSHTVRRSQSGSHGAAQLVSHARRCSVRNTRTGAAR